MNAITSNVAPSAKAVAASKAGKALTKAERQRVNFAKANASATKRLASMPQEGELIANLVTAAKSSDGAARTLAMYMNSEFAEPMKAYHCHWTAFSVQNCRTENEKALLARITDLKKQTKEACEAKGLANVNKPWSDMAKIAKEVFTSGGAREKTLKALDVRQQEDLLRLYKAGMKEERPTDTECDVNEIIGDVLVRFFKVDITKF